MNALATSKPMLATRWKRPPLHVAALWLVLALASTWYSVWTIAGWWGYFQSIDWIIITSAGQRIAAGLDPYVTIDAATHTAFRWSPVAAWLAWAIAPIGAIGWGLLHVAALAAFRNWRLSLVIALSWPFIVDLLGGNATIFIVLAAYWALCGRPWAIWAYVAALLLIPRPIMLPVAVWLLWKHPEWRWRAAALFLAHAVAVAVIGWGPEWIARLTDSGADINSSFNVGPSQLIGLWWLVVGIPLAIWLTWRGRLGWASLAISPYLLPYYLLFGVLEFLPRGAMRAAAGAASRSAAGEADTARSAAPP